MLVVSACARTSPKSDVTADPEEAFYPVESVKLDQTGIWGGFKLTVKEAEAFVHKGDIRDIDLMVHVVYHNLRSEKVNPPKDVKFEFAGNSYPAEPADDPIPGEATAERTITGTLTNVARSHPPDRDEMHDILVNTRLVLGSGTNRAVFPFTES